MGMKERLIELCRELKIGQNAFEKKCGWSNGAICNFNKGIRSDKLEGLIKAYPALNIEWLITGDGEMWKSEKEAPERKEKFEEYNPTKSSKLEQDWLVKQLEQKDFIINRLLSIMEKEKSLSQNNAD